MEMLKGINMSEKTLFGRESKCNSKYSLLQVLQILVMFPCFMIKNPNNYKLSSLSSFFGCEKDVFYRFANNDTFDWRKILYHLTILIWNKVRVRRDYKESPVCLMVDDTDFPKTGKRIENIGRVFSHVHHKTILGFKSLFLGITDGKSQFILDFAILGEEGKNKNYSMSAKDLAARFVKNRDEEFPVEARMSEYKQSKIHMMIVMITRAIRKGVRFDYVLADSWFTCSEVVRFIRSRHIKCHYLGMIKIGEKGKTKYGFDKKELTAPALIKLLEAKEERRYSRRLGCYYLSADVIFADTKVRFFFVKRNKRGPWNGLIIALQYNILSLAKRFSSYETIGGIFRDMQRKTMELSVTDRIWGIILELVTIIAEIFTIEDQDIFDAVINRSDELAHFIDYYKLKTAS